MAWACSSWCWIPGGNIKAQYIDSTGANPDRDYDWCILGALSRAPGLRYKAPGPSGNHRFEGVFGYRIKTASYRHQGPDLTTTSRWPGQKNCQALREKGLYHRLLNLRQLRLRRLNANRFRGPAEDGPSRSPLSSARWTPWLRPRAATSPITPATPST